MEGDLVNLYGQTDGSSTTGTFSLSSDVFVGTVESIVIPKGFKFKIWEIEISGEPCEVIIQVSKDGGSSWFNYKSIKMASAGTYEMKKRNRPIVIKADRPYVSGTSGTLVKFNWNQSTAALTKVAIIAEFEKAED